MSDHLTDWVECPSCHIRMDAAYNTGGEGGPEPGDPSICGYCAEIMIYQHCPEHGLSLRSATSQEIVKLRRIPEFMAALRAVQAIIAMPDR
jgi:hypothetical protein